jgi:hypothetical protein
MTQEAMASMEQAAAAQGAPPAEQIAAQPAPAKPKS